MQRVRVLQSIFRHLTQRRILNIQSSGLEQLVNHLSTVKTSLGRMSFSTVERGAPNTLDFRIYFNGPNGVISPFHDIPLNGGADKTVFNMVVEVPRWSNAKMEIATKEKLNPIKQDVKKGKLRFVKNCFPHHGYIWNYGAIPQTWEDPSHTDTHTKANGDNDPIDVCEIGTVVHKGGSVIQVKPLGILAMIDEGETDWKVIAIDVTDPLAAKLNDIDDVEKEMPGFLAATVEWFRIYKMPDGKPANSFAFNGEFKNREFALNIIQQTHEQWKELVSQKTSAGGLNASNTSVVGSPFLLTKDDAQTILNQAPAPSGESPPRDPEVDKWYYVGQ
ncbi:unnamed protein product [Owenia fusiformis]|uniref:Inorganic pyrophosphatase n=1 Tax=Owenia fusiformis TaxID=6347 RepID=A0A8J1U5W5_OWEFU|nr:unnamed protein product [Owenia fusiformis]